MHPLLTQQAVPSVFTGKLNLPSLPMGGCFQTMDALRDWLATAQIDISAMRHLFGYSAGTMDAATVQDRDFPRIMFDDIGRYIGLALWSVEAQGWSIPGQIGQLMSIQRVKDTVAEDLASRPLAGWRLCDGTSGALPNLTSVVLTDSATNTVNIGKIWFDGSSPNWSRYTVGYVGS